MSRALRRIAPLTLLGIAAACSEPTNVDLPETPSAGIAVLNAFGRSGITLLGAPGFSGTQIPLPDDFDGGGFTVVRDTVLTTSSKGAGDKLFIAALRPIGALVTIQLPSGSNPAGAASAGNVLGGGFLVALRDSAAVAHVLLPSASAAPVVSLLRGAGRCPTDVFTSAGRVWSVDANLNCDAGGYTPQGPSRLIRLPTTSGGSADTIVLDGAVNASSVAVAGDVAYVAAAGYTDYSTVPFVVQSSGVVLKIDLLTRQVIARYALPVGSTGGSLRRGGDGTLFVRFYGDVETFPSRVIALNPTTLTARRPPGVTSDLLVLRTREGAALDCGATTSDAVGWFVCVETRAGSSLSTAHVLDETGLLIHSYAAGQGVVDVALFVPATGRAQLSRAAASRGPRR